MTLRTEEDIVNWWRKL